MSNEIVRYHNDLSNLRFKDFTAADLDVFMTLCYECRDKGVKDIWIPYDEMKILMNYKGKDNKRFMKALEETSKKLHALYFEQKDDAGNFRLFHFFSVFETILDKNTKENKDRAGNYLHVKVAEEFTYLLNQLEIASYTAFELKEFANLKSTYSKHCYRQLKRFKYNGWWRVSMKDFRTLLDIPESYTQGMINSRIINKIKEELSPLFRNLDITPEEIKVRGGRQIWGYTFGFDREEKQEYKRTLGGDTAQITDMLCPDCGQPLYSLKNGEGKKFYGHIDGWKANAVCNRTFSTKFDAMGNIETPSRDHPNNYDY